MCLNVCKSLRFFLAKNKPVREQITAVRGAGRWRAEPRTPSWHRLVAPLERSPAVGLVPAAGTNPGVMRVESSRERVQGCRHKGSTGPEGLILVLAKSPGERASRGGEAGGFGRSSGVPGVSLLSLTGSLTSCGYGTERDFNRSTQRETRRRWCPLGQRFGAAGQKRPFPREAVRRRQRGSMPTFLTTARAGPPIRCISFTSDFLKRVGFVFPE